MEFDRYGKLNWKDYIIPFVPYVGVILLGIVLIFLCDEIFLGIGGIVLSVGLILQILRPYREHFSVGDHLILAREGRQKYEIPIPPNVILVLSKAARRDICVHACFLKDKYTVSILHSVSLEEVLEKIHESRGLRYTSTHINDSFPFSLLYSFVYHEDAFAQILKQSEAIVLVPEFLVDRIDLSAFQCRVYIDKRC